jgi:hypothetical protein
MENLGLFAVHKTSPNTQNVFKHKGRIRGKNLCVHGEDAKRLLAKFPKTQNWISRLVMVQHEIFLHPYFLYNMGIWV